MSKVFIKYNPYKVETEITIDGAALAENSTLNKKNERLQMWIEDLPTELKKECNTNQFDITFKGTILDFEDLQEIAEKAKKDNIQIDLTHRSVNEIGDKEKDIGKIFDDIQKGPFRELAEDEVKNAFNDAKNSNFEIAVVATMSAGKSTLINSLLGKKLMPVKNEACTATITKIIDNDLGIFRAEAYDEKGTLLETHENLTLADMTELNSTKEVSTIKIYGNIPFVTAEDVKLVLVDTPGPNNSHDEQHREVTYKMVDESSKVLVLYVLNATQLETNDDNNFLGDIAKSMKVNGKQSKDRFMFIVNKLDTFTGGEDDTKASLEKVKKYLERFGIVNPTIFPAAALPALYIRTMKDLSRQEKSRLDVTVCDYQDPDLKMLHLEKYAPLPQSVKDTIDKQLEQARNNKDIYAEALIHTGIIQIESAIRMYIQKYAKTAKIKNIVDTFDKKLESAKSFENTKNLIAKNESEHKNFVAQIEKIKHKIDSGENAQQFKNKIDTLDLKSEAVAAANMIVDDAIGAIKEQIAGTADDKLTREKAEKICKKFKTFSSDIQAKTKVKLENTLSKHAQKAASRLLQEYKVKIAELAQDMNFGSIDINPFELMIGDMGNSDNAMDLISGITQKEKVEAGSEWIENTDKKWYKPWTWLQEKGYYKTIYENREFVLGSKLADDFFAPLKANMYENTDSAICYAKTQTNIIKVAFKKKFDELDSVLTEKLSELERCSTDEKFAKKVLAESKAKLEWLKDIKKRLDAISEI